MLTKHNVKTQKVDITKVPLQLFYNIISDIYRHAHIRVRKTAFLRCLV